MTIHLGYVAAGSTLYIPFHTFSSVGASVTITGLAVTDIKIYKNGSVTQRASEAGYTLLDTDGIDFDALTGIHGFSIDLNDNTDAGFYAAGSTYWIVVSAITVDSQTVSFVAATFFIGPIAANVTQAAGTAITASAGRMEVNTTHAAGTAWGSGAITAASIAADAITDAKVASDVTIASVTGAVGSVTGAVGSVGAGGISAASFAANAITAAKLDPDVTTELQAGLATASALATAQTDISAILVDTGTTLDGRLPAALVSGRMDASVGAMAANVMTAAAAAADLTTELQTGLATAASIAALNNLSAAQVNAEADTALSDVGLTTTITGRIDAAMSTRATPAQVNTEVVDGLAVDVIADSVPADGSRPTIAQALYMIAQFLTEKAVSGTTVTVKKPDGSTSLMTFTLDDASNPTSITRAS